MKMMHNLVFGDSGETCQEKMKHHNRGELVLLGNETIQIYGIDGHAKFGDPEKKGE